MSYRFPGRPSFLKLALSLAILLVLTPLAFPNAPAALPPVPQDDAGSGADAPNGPEGAPALAANRVHAGALPDAADAADWYRLPLEDGDVVHVRLGAAFACVTLLSPALEDVRTGCARPVVEGDAVTARVDAAGEWFVRVARPGFPATPHPEPYRIAVGVNAHAPDPLGADLRLSWDAGVLAPVTPADAVGPHVVVAVVDTGVNPYHTFFDAPALAEHPSTWLAGYPADAERVDLTRDAATVRDALEADAAQWARVRESRYDAAADAFDAHVTWFPGSRVIAALAFAEFDYTKRHGRLVYDEFGHGTASTGLAAGANLPEAQGNVLVVSIETDGSLVAPAVLWAARQPWIDAISLSWGAQFGTPVHHEAPGELDVEHATREAFARGKPVILASMNGVTNTGILPEHCVTYGSHFAGPPWVTRIGAADAATGSPSWWHCVPVDATAATDVAAPATRAFTEHAFASGTSASAPNVAGHLAHLLLDARQAELDVAPLDALPFLLNASRPAAPAVGMGREPGTPVTQPVDQGFGYLDVHALDAARERLLAGLPPEPRPELDAWRAADRALRESLWGAVADATAPERG